MKHRVDCSVLTVERLSRFESFKDTGKSVSVDKRRKIEHSRVLEVQNIVVSRNNF